MTHLLNRHLDSVDSDREGRFGFSPDSEPCLPVAPGAPAAVELFGLVTCFCVAALGFTLVPTAGPEVSPCTGSAVLAIEANSVINSIPANKRALTVIVVTRCLLWLLPETHMATRVPPFEEGAKAAATV
ncbi:MAG TPA: hypothetical protein VHU44_14655 [Acidobacteriaceae bacterium]|jgi:hypothetical protein|nr:hypothetical protein [Acidobacteriaceae bacterium]